MKTFFLLLIILLLGLTGEGWGQTTILSEDFESGVPPTGWVNLQGGSGNLWSSMSYGSAYGGTGAAECKYHLTNPSNAWLISPAVSLTAGITYTITYYERTSATYNEQLKVTVGTAQTIAGQSTILQTLSSHIQSTYTLRTTYFTPSSNGTYYFGWNCYSVADMYYEDIDDILITAPARSCGSCTPVDNALGTIGTTVYGYNISGNCGNGGSWVGSFTGESGAIYYFDLCPDAPGTSSTADFDIDIKITDASCTILDGVDGSCSVSNIYRPNDFQWSCTSNGTYNVILAPYSSYNSHTCSGTASNTFTLYYYKESACTPTITLGSNAPTASNQCASTLKVPIQSFSLAVSGACNGNLTNIGFTTTGTYLQADISKYQLWYNSSNNLGTATQVGTDLASSGGAGARTFAAFTSPTLTSGTTYYFWITTDISASPTNNSTIACNAITTTDLTSTSTKAGSTASGGAQTIKASPSATNTSTQSICTSGSATLAGNNPTVGTGAWTVFSGPSTLSTQFTSTTIYNTTFTPAGGAGSYVVRWTISNSPCTSSSADATITVNAPPSTATNGSTQTICNGSSAPLSGNNPTTGTGAWTVFSGPSTLSTQFANTATYNTTFTPAGGAGSYVVRWTISNSPCTSSSADATITVNANPTTPGAITSNSPQCVGTGVTFTKGSCSVGTCYWVSSTTGTETTNSAATYTTATTAGTYNVWVRALSSGCWSTAVTASGTVSASPAAPTSTAGSGATSTSFNANWNATSGATGYYLDVCTDAGFTTFVSGYNNLDVLNVITKSVTGLNPCFTYYYRVRAYSTCGTSSSSGSQSIATTGCDAACSGAINIPTAPVTDQALSCTGTALPGNLSDVNVPTACGGASNYYKGGQEALYTFIPTVTGTYTISYSGQTWSAIYVYSGSCPTTGTCVGSAGSSGSTQSLDVTLTSGTLYYIWFDTWPTPNSPCAGTFSILPPGSCTTPGTPTTLTGSGTGETTATISWIAGTPAGSATVTYYWEVDNDGTDAMVTSGSTTSTSVNVTGLPCGSTYHFEVRAFTSCNSTYSAWATSGTFSTSACGTHCYTAPSYDWTITPSTSWQTHGSNNIQASECRIYRIFMYAAYGYDFSLCDADGVGSSSNTDSDLELFDASGVSQWYIDAGSACPSPSWYASTIGSSYTNWYPPADGYYYLKADQYSGSALTYILAYKYTSTCATPGTPISLSGTATSTTTANLSWASGTPTGSPTLTYYWEVHDASETVIQSGNTTGVSSTVSGLTCNTTYHFHVRAYTSCNATYSSWSSGSSTFTTSACGTHCYTPPTFDWTITPTTSWQTHGSNSILAGECRIYKIYLYAANGYDFSICAADGVGGTSNGDSDFEMFDATGISQWYIDAGSGCPSPSYYASTLGSPYASWYPPHDGYFYLKVDHYSGSALAFTLAYKYTTTCTTPGSPVSLIGNGSGETTATISWATGSPAGSPNITYYWEVDDNVTDAMVTSGNTTSETVNVTGLSCGTTYHFEVRSFTSCNSTYSSWSTSGTFSTSNCPTEHCYTAPTFDWTITPTTSWQTHGSNTFTSSGCRIYEISMTTGNSYDFSLCSVDAVGGSAATGDADLRMYDASGTELWYIDGASACSYDATTLGSSYQGWTPPANGFYYLKVSEFYASALTYTLAYKYFTGCITPAAAGTIIGTTPVCQGQNGVSFYVDPISNATGYSWSLPSGATIASGTNTNSITVNFSGSASSGNITVYGTDGACSGTVSPDYAITVTPTSTGGTASATSPICSGSSSSLTLSGNTGIINWQYWSGSSWDNTGGTTTPYIVSPTSNTQYRAEVTSGLCNPAYSTTVTITVDQPSVSGTAAGSATICSGSSTNLSLSGNTGTFIWQYWDGSTFINTAGTTTPYSVSPASNTQYRAVVTNGVCNTVYSNTVTISVDQASAGGTAAATSPICSGSTSSLSLTGNTGNILWEYFSGSWQSTGGTTNPYSVGPTSNTQYRARVTNGVCASAFSNTITVTVHTTSTAAASLSASPTTVASGGSSTLTLSGGSLGTGASWYWYSGGCGSPPGNFISSGSGTSIVVNPTSTTSYYVRAENSCASTNCVSATVIVTGVGGMNNNGATILVDGVTIYIDGDASGCFLNYTSGNLGTVTFANNGVLKIEGDLGNYVTNGLFGTSPNNGYVVLCGTTSQVLKGDNPINFFNLTMTNSGGAILSANENIYGLLSLNSGKITTSSTYLLTMQSGSSITGASNTSFIDGPVKKIGTTDFTFPTGKNSNYQPITVKSITGGATDAYTAEYFMDNPQTAYNSNRDASINHLSQCEYWILNQSSGTPTAIVEAAFDANSCGVTSLPDMIVARWNGTQWKDHTGSCTNCYTGNTTAGTAISNGAVTSFSPFTFGSKTGSNPLPIQLLSFDASCKNDVVTLNWKTSSEINCDYFTVENTTDMNIWNYVTKVNGSGNSNSPKEYTAFDILPENGVLYYRLSETDFDGIINYFVPVQVTCNDNNSSSNQFEIINIYKINSNKLNIIYSIPEESETGFIFYNMLGQEITKRKQQSDSGLNSIKISSDEFSPGIYLISIFNKGKVITRKIIMQ